MNEQYNRDNTTGDDELYRSHVPPHEGFAADPSLSLSREERAEDPEVFVAPDKEVLETIAEAVTMVEGRVDTLEDRVAFMMAWDKKNEVLRKEVAPLEQARRREIQRVREVSAGYDLSDHRQLAEFKKELEASGVSRETLNLDDASLIEYARPEHEGNQGDTQGEPSPQTDIGTPIASEPAPVEPVDNSEPSSAAANPPETQPAADPQEAAPEGNPKYDELVQENKELKKKLKKKDNEHSKQYARLEAQIAQLSAAYRELKDGPTPLVVEDTDLGFPVDAPKVESPQEYIESINRDIADLEAERDQDNPSDDRKREIEEQLATLRNTKARFQQDITKRKPGADVAAAISDAEATKAPGRVEVFLNGLREHLKFQWDNAVMAVNMARSGAEGYTAAAPEHKKERRGRIVYAIGALGALGFLTMQSIRGAASASAAIGEITSPVQPWLNEHMQGASAPQSITEVEGDRRGVEEALLGEAGATKRIYDLEGDRRGIESQLLGQATEQDVAAAAHDIWDKDPDAYPVTTLNGETIMLHPTDIDGVGVAEDGTKYDAASGRLAFHNYDPSRESLVGPDAITTSIRAETPEGAHLDVLSKMRTEPLTFAEYATGFAGDAMKDGVDILGGLGETEYKERLQHDPAFFEQEYRDFKRWMDERGVAITGEDWYEGHYYTTGAVDFDGDGDRDLYTIDAYGNAVRAWIWTDRFGNQLGMTRHECTQLMVPYDKVTPIIWEDRPVIPEEEVPKYVPPTPGEKTVEQDASSKTAEEDASSKTAEEDASSKTAEEDASSKTAEEDASSKTAEEDASSKTAEEDASSKTAEEDASSKTAEEDASEKDPGNFEDGSDGDTDDEGRGSDGTPPVVVDPITTPVGGGGSAGGSETSTDAAGVTTDNEPSDPTSPVDTGDDQPVETVGTEEPA